MTKRQRQAESKAKNEAKAKKAKSIKDARTLKEETSVKIADKLRLKPAKPRGFKHSDHSAILPAVLRYRTVRPIKDFRPRGKSEAAIKNSFLRHALQLYRVPKFLDCVWESDFDQATCGGWRRFYAAVGSGESPRKMFAHLPFIMTAKAAHIFMNSTWEMSPEPRVRCAQAKAAGVKNTWHLANAIVRIFPNPTNEEFIASIMQWFATHWGDPHHYITVLDYLAFAKDEDRDFSMRGRTWQSLLRDADEWHVRFRMKDGEKEEFSPSGFAPFHVEFKDKTHKGLGLTDTAGLSIVEILSSEGLAKEGREMRHCVAAYAPRIKKGDISIWSMRAVGPIKRLLTLELDNRIRSLVQLRGKLNRAPTSAEHSFIKQWAQQNELLVYKLY